MGEPLEIVPFGTGGGWVADGLAVHLLREYVHNGPELSEDLAIDGTACALERGLSVARTHQRNEARPRPRKATLPRSRPLHVSVVGSLGLLVGHRDRFFCRLAQFVVLIIKRLNDELARTSSNRVEGRSEVPVVIDRKLGATVIDFGGVVIVDGDLDLLGLLAKSRLLDRTLDLGLIVRILLDLPIIARRGCRYGMARLRGIGGFDGLGDDDRIIQRGVLTVDIPGRETTCQ